MSQPSTPNDARSSERHESSHTRLGAGALVPLLSLDEAARLLRMSRRTLQRRITVGGLRVYRDGRIVGVSPLELERYIRRHTVAAPPAAPGGAEHRHELPRGVRLWD